MKKFGLLVFSVVTLSISGNAQQRMDTNGMNYLTAPKPNSILYHDTLYKGSVQFRQLFYRDGNIELIQLYEKHQSNKIAGQVFAVAGTLASIVGLSMLSSGGNNSTAWIVFGTGFAATITGGYLTLMGQRNLQMAVTLFNHQHSKGALGVGMSKNNIGLVYKF
jgi:hypothetical protein